MKPARSIAAGAAAGGAGVTALNAVTYLDMAVRGRPSSSTPQQTVETIAEKPHVPIPGDDEHREDRVNGLGPLTGIATGVAVGALMGLARSTGRRVPLVPAGLAAGAAAMLSADAPMAALGVSDPKSWSVTDWLSDAVPHAAYGMVVARVLDQWDRRDRRSPPRRSGHACPHSPGTGTGEGCRGREAPPADPGGSDLRAAGRAGGRVPSLDGRAAWAVDHDAGGRDRRRLGRGTGGRGERYGHAAGGERASDEYPLPHVGSNLPGSRVDFGSVNG